MNDTHHGLPSASDDPTATVEASPIPAGRGRETSAPTGALSRRLGDAASSGAVQPPRRPRSFEEAEERYRAARDVWTAAMRAASSARPAELAALAVAQDAYERAAAERARWRSGPRTAIPVEAETDRRPIDIVVGQELAWRKMHREDAEEQSAGLLGRLFGRRRSR